MYIFFVYKGVGVWRPVMEAASLCKSSNSSWCYEPPGVFIFSFSFVMNLQVFSFSTFLFLWTSRCFHFLFWWFDLMIFDVMNLQVFFIFYFSWCYEPTNVFIFHYSWCHEPPGFIIFYFSWFYEPPGVFILILGTLYSSLY